MLLTKGTTYSSPHKVGKFEEGSKRDVIDNIVFIQEALHIDRN